MRSNTMNENTADKPKPRRRGGGPRTQAGKRKAAANALRHGLATAVGADPVMAADAARIAAALAGSGRFPRRPDLINRVAEAQAEMMQARGAKAALINLAMAENPAQAESVSEAIVRTLPNLIRIDRYERRAMFRRNRALRLLRRDATLGY
jgi:hypothetical protein